MTDKRKLESQPNNPLHGVKLLEMLEYLVAEHGWDNLAHKTGINVFENRPTIKSSLKMLRKTPWAREKIEMLYLESFRRLK
ncbi:VF530 family protein [Portibacter marinus]|uniref:VF530 family protein n=1 Tax=Portibacter marinus TaxID=2898660 RepID=UPI001F28C22D|nr:VF530 family protein [Portibacter marinus]